MRTATASDLALNHERWGRGEGEKDIREMDYFAILEAPEATPGAILDLLADLSGGGGSSTFQRSLA